MATKITSFDIALSAKKGKIDPETLKGASRKIYNEMSESEIEAALNSSKHRRGSNIIPRQTQRRFKST
jgi:uncharacterized protein YaaN involved in tellurite resistance